MRERARSAARRLGLTRADALILVAFALLAVLLFRRAWADPAGHSIGTPGDPPLHMWFLRWTPHALAHGINPLFTEHINFPDGVNLMWNTFMPLTGLVVAPVSLVGGPIVAYNVVISAAFTLSGWATYMVFRRYVGRPAAFVGGLVFAFSPYMVSQALTHSNLVQVFLVPLALALLDEIAVRQRLRVRVAGVLLGLLVSAQLFITEELAVHIALGAALTVAALALLRRTEVAPRVRYVATTVAVGAVVALVTAGPALAFQFFGRERVEHGVLQAAEIRSSDLLSFVVPTELQQVHPSWASEITSDFTDSCCVDEWGSYVGVPLLLLLGYVVVRHRQVLLVRVAAFVGAALLLLSMGPHLHVRGTISSFELPFWLLERLPVLGNVQPRRLMLGAWLSIGLLLSIFVDDLLRRPGRRGKALGLGACGLALIPLVPRFDFPATDVRPPEFFTTSAVHAIPEGSTALLAPFARDTNTSMPMLWQAAADFRFKMPEGYILGPDDDGRFSFLPEASVLSLTMESIQGGHAPPVLTPVLRRALGDDLAARSVASVVVGPMRARDAMEDFFEDLLRRPPRRVGGVALWTGVDRLPR